MTENTRNILLIVGAGLVLALIWYVYKTNHTKPESVKGISFFY